MLSPRKINRSSPSKENQSPTRTPRDVKKDMKSPSLEVLMSAISDLQSLVVRNGGLVPQNLKFGLQPKINLISPTKTSKKNLKTAEINHEVQVKKLKVKVNDLQFALKKSEEDSAEYKVISKMQKEKEVKKLKDDIHRLQKQIVEDNQRWEQKFTEMQQIYENNSKEFQIKIKKQREEYVKSRIQCFDKEIQETIQRCNEKIQKTIKEKQFQIESIVKQNQIRLYRQKEKYNDKKVQEEKKYRQEVKKVEIQKEQIFLALTSEKKTENNKFDEERLNFSKLKEKLYTDLYLVRKEKEELEKTIQKLKDQVILLKKEIQGQERQKVEQNQAHKSQIEMIETSFNNVRQDLQKQYKKKHEALYNQFSKKFSRVLETVRDMDDKKKKREALFNELQVQMEKRFDQRPSRSQDTQSINKQKYEIVVKNEKITELQKQIKRIKLQRENNDKNYNRIFSAQGNRNKKTIAIDKESSREKIYKQANTVDMSFLLKVCQKHF